MDCYFFDKVTDRLQRMQQSPGRLASSHVQSSIGKCRQSSDSSSGTESPAHRRRHKSYERVTGRGSPNTEWHRKGLNERQKNGSVDRLSSISVPFSHMSKPHHNRGNRKRGGDEEVENGHSDRSRESSKSSDSRTSPSKSMYEGQSQDSPTMSQQRPLSLKERAPKANRLSADRLNELLNMLNNTNKKICRQKQSKRRRDREVSDDSASESNREDSDVSDRESYDDVRNARISQPEKWMKHFVSMFEEKKLLHSNRKRQKLTAMAAAAVASTSTNEGHNDRVTSSPMSLDENVTTAPEITVLTSSSDTFPSTNVWQRSVQTEKRRGLLPTPPPASGNGMFQEPQVMSMNRCRPPDLFDLEMSYQRLSQAANQLHFAAGPYTGGSVPIPQPPQQPQSGVFWPQWVPGADVPLFHGDSLMPSVKDPWTPGFQRDRVDGRNGRSDSRDQGPRSRRSGDEHRSQERRPSQGTFCRVCNVIYHEPFQTHRYSESHKKRDKTARRGCQLCKTGAFKSYPDYLAHMDGEEHAEKKVELDNEVDRRRRQELDKAGLRSKPDVKSSRTKKAAVADDDVIVIDGGDCEPSSGNLPMTSATPSIATDVGLNEELSCDGESCSSAHTNEETSNDDAPNAVGSEFVIRQSGFFCKLCRKFWQQERYLRQHCSTDSHCQNFEKYVAQQQSVPSGVESQP